MELLEITEGVYSYYCRRVKDNKNVDYHMAKKKLNRNILLANRYMVEEEKSKVTYYYGRLRIIVENDIIVYLKNHTKNKGFVLDMEKFNELNALYGIVSNKLEGE